MFQRQPRQPFPVRNMILLAAAIVSLLVVLLKRQANTLESKEILLQTSEASNGSDTTLRPFEWFHALREYPYFIPDMATYEAALYAAQTETVATKPRDILKGFNTQWKVEGPGNIGARVNTIAVHPTDQNIIYIGYSTGGVWKTVNGGGSWLPIFDGQIYSSIGCITLDPSNPNTVYIGLGDPCISGFPFIGNGVYKSTDGGATWQHLGLADQRIVSEIIVDPTNPNTIFVATMGLPFERDNNRGLYKSMDGGMTWTQKLFISDQAGIIDLKMAPNNPNVLYAAAWNRIRNNQESLISGNDARIWKSTDGGNNWAILQGGLPQDAQSRIGLSIDQSNAQHIVATYANNSLQFGGLYESFDAGQTWQLSLTTGLETNFQSNFAWYFGEVRINPFNPQDIWILGVNTWRSQDGGANWAVAVGWNNDVHVDHHDLVFLSATDFLIATDGGLYKSTDNGLFWDKIEQIPTTQLYRVAHNPHQPELYYGGAQDNGTFDGNRSMVNDWNRLYGGDGFQAVFHPTEPNIYYFEAQNGSIGVTTNNGEFFESGSEGINSDDRRNWDMPYFISKTNESVMYTGTYRVYKSVGHPAQWQPISDDLTDGIIFSPRFHTITTLSDCPIEEDLLYVGTTDGNVWRGLPNVQQWTNITAGLPERYVTSVKASPNNANRVFVSHSGYRSNDFTAHLHRSDNKGNTWEPINGDLPNLAINDIQILPGHQDSVIFVGTDGGVYGTLDGGTHWERLGQGIPSVPVYDLDINPIKKTLFAGTHGRSIFSFALDSLQIGLNSSVFNPITGLKPQLKVTPNLSSEQVNIVVANLPSKQRTSLIIMDMSGRLIWQKEVGNDTQQIPVPLTNFASGVYIVYAQSGNKTWGQQKFVKAE